jgi:hypothetical protein
MMKQVAVLLFEVLLIELSTLYCSLTLFTSVLRVSSFSVFIIFVYLSVLFYITDGASNLQNFKELPRDKFSRKIRTALNKNGKNDVARI